jgi:micrococcal nuclease
MRRAAFGWACVAVLATGVSPALAANHDQEFKATVVEVIDGDTLKVAHDGTTEIVLLLNIDAPEKGQPYADRAKQQAENLCLGEEVRVVWQERDVQRRILGTVHEDEGLNLSFEMVRAGLAWNYKHFEHDRTLAELETEARKAHRGLWSDKHPTPPWEYRQAQEKLNSRLPGDDRRSR